MLQVSNKRPAPDVEVNSTVVPDADDFKVITNCPTRLLMLVCSRAVDPHSFYADPDPAVFLNADPDPGPA